MAKPPISYGVVRNYGSFYNVIAITSKDKSYYYGRRDNDQTTRGKLTDLLAERSTRDGANSLLAVFRETTEKWEPQIKAAQKKVDELRDCQQKDLKWQAKHHK